MLLLAVLACSADSTSDAPGAADPTGPTDPVDSTDPTNPTDPTVPWAIPESGVITVETRDGVTLEADYYPSETEGAPGVVLLHMIPPSNDRTNWPESFITSLTDEGWSVLNLDRRGAGGSDGVAFDAYTGPDGKKDVEAAVLKLQADGYGDLVLLGASNGTTSVVDYTVWAPGQGLPEPVALGLMTGGDYTENQNAMEDLPEVPTVFTYSTLEADWSVAQQPIDPGSWSFLEYGPGGHGTIMFTIAPEVADDLVDFLVDNL